jgi:hypothetical protein
VDARWDWIGSHKGSGLLRLARDDRRSRHQIRAD